MRAIVLVPGPTGGHFDCRDVPKPVASGERVLVKVRAAGTNRGELLLAAAARSDNTRAFPAGIEFAGEIAEASSAAGQWRAGDRVMGRAPGSYAEFVAVHFGHLMRIPPALTWAQAAAIPNVFVTAHDAIATAGRLQSGESVLITAASSGVGTAALQLARFLGAARVIASTRGTSKRDVLAGLGANLVLDVTQPGWVESLKGATDQRGVDLIIDMVGGPMLPGNVKALAIKGRIISVGRNGGNLGECNLDQVALKRASIIGVTFRTRTPEEALLCSQRFAEACLDGFVSGALRPVLDTTFPFERIADAHARMLSDAQVGKIVLTFEA